MKSSKLFRKYFSAFMIILLSAFTFLGSALLVFSTQFWTRDRQNLLLLNVTQAAFDISNIYAGNYQIYWEEVDRPQAIANVLDQASNTFEAQLFVFSTDGRVIACPETVHDTWLPSPVLCPLHGAWRMPWEIVSPALTGNFTQVSNVGGLFDQSMLIAAQPFTLQGETAGFVLAAQPFSAGLFDYLGGILRLFLLSALVVSVLVFAAVFLITRSLVKPLNAMIAATKRFAQGDFRHRVTSSTNDELRLLADAFNAMAINLATLEASRRSFVANVSHELKTPMTSIGGFIDGMLDGTIAPDDHEKYLALVSGEVRRLSRLVTGMLNLSRIEAGQLQMQRSAFDLSELLFTTLLSFEKMIAEKHLELSGLDDLQPLTMIGDQDLLTQVFYNLIDNAVKFTPPGGEITLHLRQTPTANHITLRNTGTGLTPDELTRIFERFYKADQSRSYDTRGAGLGLYLVQTIVRMHGGDIAVDSDHRSWVEFIVELPLD
ncbi:MAG: HAMP domain-containing histidine kinase [Oscillospiraceae bacterium]|nr:HAMP domain-containing histidine kinase [Oscillospiraceae bacterium]